MLIKFHSPNNSFIGCESTKRPFVNGGMEPSRSQGNYLPSEGGSFGNSGRGIGNSAAAGAAGFTMANGNNGMPNSSRINGVGSSFNSLGFSGDYGSPSSNTGNGDLQSQD